MTNQQELLLTRGIPGSGKSTYAYKWLAEDPENRVRVNRDDLRMELYGKYVILDDKGGMDKNAEGRVTQEEQKRIRAALKTGKSVIVDNTNINMRVIPGYQKLAQENGANLSHKDFPISLEEAQRRNAARDRVVDPTVIERMYKNNLGPNGEFHLFPGDFKTTPFKKPARKEHGVIYDMDGTLTDISGVRHFVQGKFRNFDAFHRSSLFCPPNQDVVDLAKDTAFAGMSNVIVTARESKYRDVTEKWLRDHDVPFSNLYMRPTGDMRKDGLVKADILKDILKDYDIVHAVDDRPEVIDVWHSAGIQTTLVPGLDYTDEEVAASKPVRIENIMRSGKCLRCGRPVAGGRVLGPQCAKIV